MAATLFDKYGGFAKISKVIMSFYDKVLDSDQIGPYFEDSDVRQLIDHQTKFIASVMGGPASYSNDALRQVHAAHNINQADFDETARLLRATLEEYELDAADIDTVMNEISARASFIISDRTS